MVKLTAAKCPSCGAAIEVNKKLENVICQYCGDTILIEDAIAKIKVEHSGKVKVSSVKDSSDKIEIARKYIKVNKYEDAMGIIKQILNDDPFDLEALVLQNNLLIKEIEFDLNISDDMYEDMKDIDDFNVFMCEYKKGERKSNFYSFVEAAKKKVWKVEDNRKSILKTDSQSKYTDYVKELGEKIKKYEKIIAEANKEKKEKDAVVEVLKNKIDNYIKYEVGNRYAMLLRKLRKITKKLGMNKGNGELPFNINSFKLDNVSETSITIRDYSRVCYTYSTDQPKDLKEMIDIVDKEYKKMVVIHLVIREIVSLPALLLLISGHWILAIIAFFRAPALFEELFII